MLTQAQALSIFSYDPETGILVRKSLNRRVESRNDRGYVLAKVGPKSYKAHRVIWLMMTGEWPEQVDHIDQVKDNNCWANLRNVDNSLNNHNKPAMENSTGFPGVKRTPAGRFVSHFVFQKERHYCGTFDSPEEAHAAYLVAREKCLGTGFPLSTSVNSKILLDELGGL